MAIASWTLVRSRGVGRWAIVSSPGVDVEVYAGRVIVTRVSGRSGL